MDNHFIREKVMYGVINMQYINTEDKLVDILTKAIGWETLHMILDELGL